MNNQEMVNYLKNLAYHEREYLSDVLDNVENPHEIANKLEEAANMLKEQEQQIKFLKDMQKQMVKSVRNDDIGRMVINAFSGW